MDLVRPSAECFVCASRGAPQIGEKKLKRGRIHPTKRPQLDMATMTSLVQTEKKLCLVAKSDTTRGRRFAVLLYVNAGF